MNEFEKEFDDKMNAHAEVLRKGQQIAFNALVKEIKTYNYTTIAQVNGALSAHLERLNEIEAHQYEVDARADNVTEQMPNV